MRHDLGTVDESKAHTADRQLEATAMRRLRIHTRATSLSRAVVRSRSPPTFRYMVNRITARSRIERQHHRPAPGPQRERIRAFVKDDDGNCCRWSSAGRHAAIRIARLLDGQRHHEIGPPSSSTTANRNDRDASGGAPGNIPDDASVPASSQGPVRSLVTWPSISLAHLYGPSPLERQRDHDAHRGTTLTSTDVLSAHIAGGTRL